MYTLPPSASASPTNLSTRIARRTTSASVVLRVAASSRSVERASGGKLSDVFTARGADDNFVSGMRAPLPALWNFRRGSLHLPLVDGKQVSRRVANRRVNASVLAVYSSVSELD